MQRATKNAFAFKIWLHIATQSPFSIWSVDDTVSLSLFKASSFPHWCFALVCWTDTTTPCTHTHTHMYLYIAFSSCQYAIVYSVVGKAPTNRHNVDADISSRTTCFSCYCCAVLPHSTTPKQANTGCENRRQPPFQVSANASHTIAFALTNSTTLQRTIIWITEMLYSIELLQDACSLVIIYIYKYTISGWGLPLFVLSRCECLMMHIGEALVFCQLTQT